MKFLATAFLSFALLAPASAAPINLAFSVDTSSIAGSDGYLSLQFNPGFDADAAIATIFGFSAPDASFFPALPMGDVTGELPDVVTIRNTDFFNELFQPLIFGPRFQFVVSFSGPAVDAPSGALTGSTFSLSILDSTLSSFLLSDDPSGAALIVDLFSDASISYYLAPAGPDQPSAVSVVTPVPEPATGLLALAALGFLGLRRRAA